MLKLLITDDHKQISEPMKIRIQLKVMNKLRKQCNIANSTNGVQIIVNSWAICFCKLKYTYAHLAAC